MFIPRGGGNIVIPKVGDTVNIGNIDYLVVHIDETNKHMYFAKKYWDKSEDTRFGETSSTLYDTSTLRSNCVSFLERRIPTKLVPLLVTLECGYGCPVFIPTKAQVSSYSVTSGSFPIGPGEWEYFKDNNSRVFKDVENKATGWWLQDGHQNPWFVYSHGVVGYCGFSNVIGFRPCFCIDISAITKYSVLEQLFSS